MCGAWHVPRAYRTTGHDRSPRPRARRSASTGRPALECGTDQQVSAPPRPGRGRCAYACRTCGNEGEWLGQPITLQIDHINGDWRDNRRENLRYPCPNCHALTETWCRQKARTPLVA
ncbi:HNH endonuclease [Streptomyces sp. NPDC002486]